MDVGPHIMIYVGTNVNPHLVQKLFGELLLVRLVSLNGFISNPSFVLFIRC